MRHGFALLTFLAATMPGVAYASSEVGSQSSGSMTITVVIPPVAAALAAKSEGAVGLWTAIDSKSTLMINLPSILSSDGTAKASIYRGSNMLFAVSVDANPSVRVAAATTTPLNGMTRESFELKRVAIPKQPDLNQDQPVTLLVTAL